MQQTELYGILAPTQMIRVMKFPPRMEVKFGIDPRFGRVDPNPKVAQIRVDR